MTAFYESRDKGPSSASLHPRWRAPLELFSQDPTVTAGLMLIPVLDTDLHIPRGAASALSDQSGLQLRLSPSGPGHEGRNQGREPPIILSDPCAVLVLLSPLTHSLLVGSGFQTEFSNPDSMSDADTSLKESLKTHQTGISQGAPREAWSPSRSQGTLLQRILP